MPVIISQDQILAMPGDSITATVWVENDTGAHGTFSLVIEPADANLTGDWYGVSISPHAGQNIPANHREPFKVVLTAKRSPHGRSELVAFQVRATNARVTATQFNGPSRAAAGTQSAAPAGGSILDALHHALSGKSPTASGGIPDEEDDLLTRTVTGSVSAPEPDAILAAPTAPVIPLDTPPGSERLVELTGHHGTNVDIRLRPKSAPQTGTGIAVAGANPVGGELANRLTGTIYLYVPPVPSFDLVITPYRPDKKKGTEAEDGKRPVVSGREQGQFTVRVANTEKFPASFRLEPIGDDGSQYDLVEQYLQVAAGATEETILTARPLALSWWRWIRPYGFRVRTTPLTGAGAIDAGKAIERPGVFRQTCAWLHPAPLLALLLLLFLLSLLNQPSIDRFPTTPRYVLREKFSRQHIVSDTEADRALDQLGVTDQAQTHLEWAVSRARSVELEFHPNGSQAWQPVELNDKARRNNSLDIPVSQSGVYRLTAKAWLWGDRRQEVAVFLAPEARNRLEVADRQLHPTAGSKDIYQRLYCKEPRGFNLYQVQSFLSNSQDYQMVEPQAGVTVTIKPEDTGGYRYRFRYTPVKAGEHRCIVTVVTNSKGGNVQQYEIVDGG